MASALPIEVVLPDIVEALRGHRQVVLQAPPGAGKTTRVPLAILDAGLTDGRIVMLEPRRLATRAAAERMSDTLGEPVGRTVGYRVRGETKVSRSTRIEVVTEGILTRMIQSDPTLEGVGVLIFDEIHERSLNADLGLALALEVRSALRDDLHLAVMSATLDAEPIADYMGGAPVVTSEGFAFRVETRWLERPLARDTRFENAMADLISSATREASGGILAFLPGEGEIRRVGARLNLPGIEVLPLYGALPIAEQRRALSPSRGRKLVLATSVAETSLTIPDIRLVVDGGLARRARFDPGSGMSRLVTERVSRAEAAQRRGRAGRVAEGVCYRLWTKGEEGALRAYPPAEIEIADLAGLALELAEWGSENLSFLTQPPETALREARALLTELGALEQGTITGHGRVLAAMPLHPRLAHMLAIAGKDAATMAALLANGDPMRNAGADLATRLDAIRRNDNDPRISRIRTEARRLERLVGLSTTLDPPEQAALAYPDRIAIRRFGDDPRWLLSNGKGVRMRSDDPLAGQRLLVVTDTDGHPTEATIRIALPIAESALRKVLADRIEEHRSVLWSQRDMRVLALTEERLGAIALTSRPWKDAPADLIAGAMIDGVRQLGLILPEHAERFRARVSLLRAAGHDLPDMSDEALLRSLDAWLKPHIAGLRTRSDWKSFNPLPALAAMLDWEQTRLLDRQAPAYFETPLGRKIAVDYSGEAPEISLRLQEMFGVTRHPQVAGKPLRVTLLSPAGRPVQTTMDLPGFWATSYADVRKDMRGRYPKHPWPEDPTVADPTLRTKRRT